MDIQKYIPSEEKLKDVAGHILGNVSCWDGWDVDYGGLESDLKRFAIEIIESVLKDVSPPTTEGQNQFCITSGITNERQTQ